MNRPLSAHLILRDRLLLLVRNHFERTGEFCTVRYARARLAIPQSDVVSLAEDLRNEGEVEINTGIANAGGHFKLRMGDWLLEPIAKNNA